MARSIQQVLALGFRVTVPIHLDNDAQAAYLPWDSPGAYLKAVKALLLALQPLSLAQRANLTILVGNENSPRNAGDNPESWALAIQLYGLWEQAVGAIRNMLPGAKASIPAPFDQGPSYLKSALANLPPEVVLACQADRLDIHYGFCNAPAELPGQNMNTLLDEARALFGPLSMGEFGWEIGTPATVSQTVAWSKRTGSPAFYWEFSEPGGTQLKGNAPMMAALGLSPVVSSIPANPSPA